MASVRARRSKAHLNSAPTSDAAIQGPNRFRELDTESLKDCADAIMQAGGAQAAIHGAMVAAGVAVKRIRDIAYQLSVMTGRTPDDEQLNEAEEKAMELMGVLGDMMVEVTCEEQTAKDAHEGLLQREPVAQLKYKTPA